MLENALDGLIAGFGRAHAAALMRVNHVGEVCAQALYQGQAFTVRNAQNRQALGKAALKEQDHLVAFAPVGWVRQCNSATERTARPMAFPVELEDFRRQCERQLARPLADRIRFGFFRNANPVRDAQRNRTFDSIREYRRFCDRSYPAYYGYARPGPAKRAE